jgi:hypothetical protein
MKKQTKTRIPHVRITFFRLISVMLLLAANSGFSQILTTPVVISTLGDKYPGATGIQSVTAGESMIETYSSTGASGKLIASAGFQQPLSPHYTAPVTLLAVVPANSNNPVVIPVRVVNFQGITALSLRIDYNPSFITFDSCSVKNPLLGNIMAVDSSYSPTLHAIFITWNDASKITLPSYSLLLNLNMHYISGEALLTFNNTAYSGTQCQYLDSLDHPLPDLPTRTYYRNGLVKPMSTLSGHFLYNNSAFTPLDAVKVILRQNNASLDSVFTTSTGYYLFSGIGNGTYTVKAVCLKPWSSVNGTDALKIQRHFAGIELLTEPVRLQAADVNNNVSINGTDALKVKRRFAGMDNYFDRGDWTFAEISTGGDTIVINGASISQDFYGLCVGDVNGSNIPSPGKSMNTSLELITRGILPVLPGREVSIPVTLEKPCEIGAVSMVIGFPEQYLKVTGVKMNRPGFVCRIAEGQVRIAWSETDPLVAGPDVPLLTIEAEVSDTYPVDLTQPFVLEEESELADGWGTPLERVILIMPALQHKAAEGTGPLQDLITGCRVFPNPANTLLNLEFTLNENSMIRTELKSLCGNTLMSAPIGPLSRGDHVQRFDLSAFPGGVYFLVISNDQGSELKTCKVVIVK